MLDLRDDERSEEKSENRFKLQSPLVALGKKATMKKNPSIKVKRDFLHKS